MSWAAVATAGASVVGGLMSSNAAERGANAQDQSSQLAIAEQRRQYDQTRADNAPFRDTGVAANARLRQLLGIDSGYSGGDSGSLLRRFSMADRDADPVFQSGLEFGQREGEGAINARALAAGAYDSGATLKALTRFGNDYGSTKANESYNRFNMDNTNIYNRLTGTSGAGQAATNTVSAAGANMANNISNDLLGAGNARAAGIVGGANAWGNALSQGANAYNNSQNNNRLFALLGNRGGQTTNPYQAGYLGGTSGGE